jgi:dephospho-CoA kinase
MAAKAARVIGLTGGIGSGKSKARAFLAMLGCHPIDADAFGHHAYRPGTECFSAVVQRFGKGVVNGADGTIDRRALGSIVFGGVGAKKDLEAIVWPHIGQMIRGEVDKVCQDHAQDGLPRTALLWLAWDIFRADAQRPTVPQLAQAFASLDDKVVGHDQLMLSGLVGVHVPFPVIVAEAAVLFEAGWTDIMSEVWTTFVDRERSIERVMARNSLPRGDVEARLSLQSPVEDKIRRSDVVIDTSGPVAWTRANLVLELTEMLQRDLRV